MSSLEGFYSTMFQNISLFDVVKIFLKQQDLKCVLYLQQPTYFNNREPKSVFRVF